MRRTKNVLAAAGIDIRVRLELHGEEDILLDFANTDWETTFKRHNRPVLADLAARTKVNPFVVLKHHYDGPVAAVSSWSSTTKDSFVTEWARKFPSLIFVQSIVDENAWQIETRIRRFDFTVATIMDYSDWPQSELTDTTALAYEIYTYAMCDAQLPQQFSIECWRI